MAGALPGNLAAVLLAGGEGRRLGGTDKARLRRGAKTLLQHWVAALEKRGIPVAVVGPAHLRAELPQDALLTREDPPLGGPAAAARAGLLALEKEGLPAARKAGSCCWRSTSWSPVRCWTGSVLNWSRLNRSRLDWLNRARLGRSSRVGRR